MVLKQESRIYFKLVYLSQPVTKSSVVLIRIRAIKFERGRTTPLGLARIFNNYSKYSHLSGITGSSRLKSLRVIINFFFRSFDLSLQNSCRLLLIKLGEFKISLDLLQDSFLLAKFLSNF